MVLTASSTRVHEGRRPFQFLAREGELERLRRRLEALVAGRGGVVVLGGPVGIGCTTLARQVAGRAMQMGIAVNWGTCLPGTLDRPFGGLADALEIHALGLPSSEVQSDLAGAAGPILRVCPALAEKVPSFTPAVPLDRSAERLRLHSAMTGWLSLMARRAPLLVVVDDIELADGDLLALVEHLARRLREAPVMLLCVRSPLAGSRRGARPRGAIETIELDGLDQGATQALLGTVSDRPVAAATAALVQRISGGAPLFSIELYRHLLEEELLPGPGSTRLPPPEALPQTLTDVVAWRAARLSPASRAALNVLAAFPRGAAAHLVASIAGLVRARAVEALETLVREALATVDDRGTNYVITHPAIRLALLDALNPTLRAQLHRRVAEALEAESPDLRRELAGALAHHWAESASEPGGERGLGHCLLAAEQARAAYAPLRTVDCLRAALRLAPDDSAIRHDLHIRLAAAEAAAGLSREALADARRVLDPPTAGAARFDRNDEAITALTDVLRTLRGDGRAPTRGTAFETLRTAALAKLGADRSAHADSLAHARLALMAEHWQALALGPIAVLYWADLQPRAAGTLLRDGAEADRAEVMLVQRARTRADTAQAAQAARAWRRPPQTLRALECTVTDLVTRHGMFGEGAGWAAQYLATAQRYGSLRDEIMARLLLARCHVSLGAFATADDELGRAEAQLETLDQPATHERDWLADELLITRWSLAHFRDGGWAAMTAALAAPERPRPAGLLLAALRALGHARSGDDTRARELVTAVLEAAAQLPPLTLYRDAAMVVGIATAWEMGAAEYAATSLALVGLAAQAGAGGQVEGTLELSRARLLGLAGQVDGARAIFAEHRTSLTATGLRPLRALCDHDEAIVIAAAGPRGYDQTIHLLEAAAAQFAQLGMDGWLARVQQLMTRGLEEATKPGGRLSFTYPRGLSRHEADIVRLTAAGATPDEAAQTLGLARRAVDRLLASALAKLDGRQPDELPNLARRYGLGGL